jgi:hypothetical protein
MIGASASIITDARDVPGTLSKRRKSMQHNNRQKHESCQVKPVWGLQN